ncbi:MAG: hypothetical protein QGI45_12805, partial [Myxococcota bacterium]|nr:hypothetical protein [Myxococcota bacterium]
MVYHQKLASVFVFLLVAGGLAVFLTFGLPQDSSVPLTGDSASQSGGDPYSANSFFVVLKANEPLLKFSRNTNTGFRVMNSTSLDNVVAAHNVIDMQALLPQALDKHVGENGIHLNRVYMAFMNATAGRSTRDAALVAFSNLSSVKLAEPIGIISEPDFTPDDPYFNDPPGIFGVQHNLVMTKAALAWDFFDIEGGQFPGTLNGEFPDYEGILLASNDQGVDYTHPDLIDNLWVNQLEVAEAVVGEEV